jgi:VanZ family protein
MLPKPMRRACTALFILVLGVVVVFSVSNPLAWLPGAGESEPMVTDRRLASAFNHLAAYWVLSSLGWLGLSAPRRLIPFAVLLLLLGSSLEFAQLYIPGRTADLLDVAANSTGTLLGLVTATFIHRASHRLRRRYQFAASARRTSRPPASPSANVGTKHLERKAGR